MDKKKKIIIGIAIVLAIALVVGLFFLLNKEKEPEEQEITVRYLMEKNEEYFKTLDSLDVTVTFEHDYIYKKRDEIIKTEHQIITANTKEIFNQGLKQAQLTMTQNVEAENNNRNLNIQHDLYVEKNNGNEIKYVRETVGGVESEWIINPEQNQLYSFTDTSDFDYICKYWMGLTIEEDIVNIDGVSCYKVTGIIKNIKKITDHYGFSDVISFWFDPFSSFAYVELYFNKDTHIIQAFNYDFSKFWLDDYGVLDSDGIYSNEGTMTLSVKYNGFNNVKPIVIDDYIKENAEVMLKDPLTYPIDLENELYVLHIDDISIEVGKSLIEYRDMLKFKITNLGDNGYLENDIIYINPMKQTGVLVTTQSGKEFIVTVQNITNEIVPIDNCIVTGINVQEGFSGFNNFNIGDGKINKKSTMDQLKEVFGYYNMKYDSGSAMVYTWRCYEDWCDINVMISHDKKEITQISISCFHLQNKLSGMSLSEYLAIERENALNSVQQEDTSGIVDAEQNNS